MRRILIVGIVLALISPQVADAQGRFPRKWLIAGVGAMVAGAAAATYAVHFENDIGGCSSTKCVVPVTVLAGALLGFMIGSESDKLYSLRYAHAPPMSLRGVERSLSIIPNDLSLDQHTVFVSGEDGVEVIDAGPRLERIGLRARGLRGIGSVMADSASNRMFVGTGVGLYQFQLRGDEPGTLAHPGEISAITADSRMTAIGLGPDFLIARSGDSIEPLGDPIEEVSRVVDLEWDGVHRLWVLTEDRLAAYDVAPDGAVTFVGEHPLPVIGRRFALDGNVAYVAAGSGGIFAIDITDPSGPTEIGNWSGARFAYDVTVAAGLAYIAAGPEGLYVTRIDGNGFTAVGLAREAGFVAAVESDGEFVYLLDRSAGRLRRIPAGGSR